MEGVLMETTREQELAGTVMLAMLRERTLVAELWKQWRENHSEHCKLEWPHKDDYGDCRWPLPLELNGTSKALNELGNDFLKERRPILHWVYSEEVL